VAVYAESRDYGLGGGGVGSGGGRRGGAKVGRTLSCSPPPVHTLFFTHTLFCTPPRLYTTLPYPILCTPICLSWYFLLMQPNHIFLFLNQSSVFVSKFLGLPKI
jgi:hypothetical protein